MPSVINYNSARLNNVPDGTILTITSDAPQLLLTMGIYVSAPVSSLEIMSTIGTETPVEPTLLTGTVVVDTVEQGAARMFVDPPNSVVLSFHTILQNLPVGHHVIQLFVSTIDSDIGLGGPVTMSAWVLA
ncbi:hypothetical protein GZH47_23940 [Paenibacillus rhizovicinus]|uniref:Exosporium protein C n=1 Tax=Paenibacillus rhizovicinus TaxID=2704463 RepID=A0A6C0P4S1_9BACL|nr:hypothetical protein [Paenibacillus rhizovicinus]QHW33544.1 hypothetical protein GZH47_23940 [Paenibacillus rhizovicinus]